MTKLDTMSVFVGDNITPIEKPKTRQQKILEWRKANMAAYKSACHEHECTCTPSRAQMLLLEQWENPPID